MKIVFLNVKSGVFRGVTGEKISVINLDEASSHRCRHFISTIWRWRRLS